MNNRRKAIAGTILIILPAIFLMCSNRASVNKSTDGGKQIKLFYSFPSLTGDNKFVTVQDSQYIIYYKDLVLYKFPYTKNYSSNLLDSTGEIIEHKLIKTDTNFHCLFFRKGEKYGYFLDSIKDNRVKQVLVDSLLKNRFRIDENRIYNSNDSLLSKKVRANNISQETYVRQRKIDDWDCDTSYLFFSNQFKGIDFSFSKRIDSIWGRKLVKMKHVSNGDPKNKMEFFRQKREIIVEIMEVPIGNRQELIEFFNKFEKQHSGTKSNTTQL